MRPRIFRVGVLIAMAGIAHAFAQGTSDPPSPKVYDAQGKLIGRFDYEARTQGVFARINDVAVFLAIEHTPVSATDVSIDEFRWAATPIVAFASKDCSSGAFVGTWFAPRPVVIVRTDTQATLYIAGPGVSGPVAMNSVLQNGQCTPYQSSAPTYWNAESSFSLTQHYPEPLSVRY